MGFGSDPGAAVVFKPTRDEMATSIDDERVAVRDHNGKIRLEPAGRDVADLAFTRDGKMLGVALDDGDLVMGRWSDREPACPSRLPGWWRQWRSARTDASSPP